MESSSHQTKSGETEEDPGGVVSCSKCSFEERYHYKGKKPPFAKSFVFLEDAYIMKDPFSPPDSIPLHRVLSHSALSATKPRLKCHPLDVRLKPHRYKCMQVCLKPLEGRQSLQRPCVRNCLPTRRDSCAARRGPRTQGMQATLYTVHTPISFELVARLSETARQLLIPIALCWRLARTRCTPRYAPHTRDQIGPPRPGPHSHTGSQVPVIRLCALCEVERALLRTASGPTAVMRKAWVPLAVQGTALALLMVLQHVPESSGAFPDLGDFKRGFKANTQRCSNAHHVQLLQVMALMEAPIRTGYDRNSKCFICCLMDTYEMVTPDGEFMDGKIRRFAADLPESNFKEVINKNLDTCLREDNDDICEKCYQFAKCYYDRAKIKNGSQKQRYQRLTNYYDGSSEKLFNKVGSWARNQWNQPPSNGPRGI